MEENKNKSENMPETETPVENVAETEQTTEETIVELSEKEQSLIEEKQALKLALETAKKQADEYKDKWMRNVAEFDNYKKRNAKIWQDAFNEGQTNFLIKILPVGDNLDWAMDLDLDEKTLEGLKKIKQKYDDTLKSIEVEEINPIGEVFDPTIAEAIMQVECDEGDQPDTVKQVFQKGYKIKDKIVRYAKVSVVK